MMQMMVRRIDTGLHNFDASPHQKLRITRLDKKTQSAFLLGLLRKTYSRITWTGGFA
jgi:hypothetical protein